MSEESRRIWVVEQVQIDDGSLAQRQTEVFFTENDDGSWHWNCPEDRLDEAGCQEWNRIMEIMKDVNGEDLRHIICGAGLMDHCFNPTGGSDYAE